MYEDMNKEQIAIAYTVYSKLCPPDRLPVDIRTFASACGENLALLESVIPADEATPADRSIRKPEFSEEQAIKTLEKNAKEAEKAIDNKEKLNAILEKVKGMLKQLPSAGNIVTYLKSMIRLVTSYVKGEYSDIPRSALIIIVSAMIYVISPIDLIPDFIPVLGWIDDVAVVTVAIRKTGPEIDKYLAWANDREQPMDT